MDFFKNRKTAVAVFVIVVALFAVLGCHRSLTKACAQVEQAFFEPSVSEGYYSCPGDQLEYAARYANRLLSVIGGQLSDSVYNSLAQCRRALIDALEARDISDIYSAQVALTQAVQAADSEALALGVREEMADFSAIISDYNSAISEAADSDYNDSVDAFIASIANRFPANLLRRITAVEMPEKYI